MAEGIWKAIFRLILAKNRVLQHSPRGFFSTPEIYALLRHTVVPRPGHAGKDCFITQPSCRLCATGHLTSVDIPSLSGSPCGSFWACKSWSTNRLSGWSRNSRPLRLGLNVAPDGIFWHVPGSADIVWWVPCFFSHAFITQLSELTKLRFTWPTHWMTPGLSSKGLPGTKD